MKLLTDDIVYGKREECIYNHTVALWQNVPTGILRRYVKDQELSDELKQFKGTHTLFCKGDLPLSRLYRLLRYHAAQGIAAAARILHADPVAVSVGDRHPSEPHHADPDHRDDDLPAASTYNKYHHFILLLFCIAHTGLLRPRQKSSFLYIHDLLYR